MFSSKSTFFLKKVKINFQKFQHFIFGEIFNCFDYSLILIGEYKISIKKGFYYFLHKISINFYMQNFTEQVQCGKPNNSIEFKTLIVNDFKLSKL